MNPGLRKRKRKSEERKGEEEGETLEGERLEGEEEGDIILVGLVMKSLLILNMCFFELVSQCVFYCWMTLRVRKCANEDPGPL